MNRPSHRNKKHLVRLSTCLKLEGRRRRWSRKLERGGGFFCGRRGGGGKGVLSRKGDYYTRNFAGEEGGIKRFRATEEKEKNPSARIGSEGTRRKGRR